jgi:hypothetical protein
MSAIPLEMELSRLHSLRESTRVGLLKTAFCGTKFVTRPKNVNSSARSVGFLNSARGEAFCGRSDGWKTTYNDAKLEARLTDLVRTDLGDP